MFIGRTQELRQLEEAYRAGHSTACVLYGRYGIGKTELALTFAKEKPVVYYAARELSEREQCLCFSGEWPEVFEDTLQVLSLYDIIKQLLTGKSGQKTVIILDEFQYLVEAGPMLSEALTKLLQEENCMILLLSSSVNWIENGMVEDMREALRNITGIIKCREFSFVDMVKRCPKLTVEQTIMTYAVLGGVPGYLDYWDEALDIKENLLKLMFRPEGVLFAEAETFLKKELRELGSYNAILTSLALGNNKLNDIYARTGFSRAKISVYIKNLIELDVVEKVFSFDSQEKAFQAHINAQKGLYRIKDRYLRFWYRYVFPHLSEICSGRGEAVLDRILAEDFPVYMRECFADVCEEYLHLMAKHNRLTAEYTTWGSWYGKTGRIDIVAGDGKGHTLAGFCRFDHIEMSLEELKEYLELTELARLAPTEIFLFSRGGFTEEVKQKKRTLEQGCRLVLIGLEDL